MSNASVIKGGGQGSPPFVKYSRHSSTQHEGNTTTTGDMQPASPCASLSARDVSPLSRRRRAVAEMHSTGVAHQTIISSSFSARFRSVSDAGSLRQRGMTADESQNLIYPSPFFQERLQNRSARIPGPGDCPEALRKPARPELCQSPFFHVLHGVSPRRCARDCQQTCHRIAAVRDADLLPGLDSIEILAQ